MSAHTPGPWEWDGSVSIKAGDELVALVYSTMGGWPATNLAANARLIAAAPDLLAELDWVASNEGECLGDHPKRLARILALLAKATGGAS